MQPFQPWVAAWFRDNIGEPTPPQASAWPLIAKGQNVLVHAPTGSGKTFAAFLWALDRLLSVPAGANKVRKTGIDVLYISPLKALNNDVERNLRAPLSGLRSYAESAGIHTADIQVAMRTGDTPSKARSAMVRRPPHILITTPESLYLILTSPLAREVLRTVRSVIVDEIHTLVPNKRGSHLAVTLERLERLAPGFQRIGLSATQRPLEEVARFLGGQFVADKDGGVSTVPRPVAIVDAAYAKKMKLEVLGMPEQPEAESAGSIWPAQIPRLLRDIEAHKTTLIFANSRRQAERAADRLNAQWAAEQRETSQPEWKLLPTYTGASDTSGPFHAHHSSVAEDVRRQLENDLKAGRLSALIGTSSLELGIDIGSVDLVIQLGSPKSVTTGLQRVGRSGHSVGQTARGRIYALHNQDLVEAAAVARGMTQGDVEEIRAPRNALDILAQQVVAAVSVEQWDAHELYLLAKGAYSYEGLTEDSFRSVLKLVSGKYPRHLFSTLKARIHWDEANGRLYGLPASRLLALNYGGALVDRGAFAVYLADRKTRIGELDEEFVFETKPGDAFMLGSQVWRAVEIDDDRVVVEPAPGSVPRMPFWRGDFAWRPFSISQRLASFRAELAERIRPHLDDPGDPPDVAGWLQEEYLLDRAGASQLISHIRRQLQAAGMVSSDRTLVVETYQDAVGDRRLVVHSPFGGRVNGPWSIALASAIRERTGVEPEVQVNDDGIMFRLPDSDSPAPVDVVESLDVSQVKERVLNGLADSALFGAVFRQNSYRSLLLPGRGHSRTPFWLQRLKAKDLLRIARGFPDFPVMLETYRDCLEDAMDLPGLERIVERIQNGEIKVEKVESRAPSPVAESLDFGLISIYMYEWDAPKAERSIQTLRLDRTALAQLFRDPSFAGVLKPEAVSDIKATVSHTAPGRQVRSSSELAQMLEEMGALTTQEIAQRSDGEFDSWLEELEDAGRATRLQPGLSGGEQTWVLASLEPEYSIAFGRAGEEQDQALEAILRRWLAWSGPVNLESAAGRFPFPAAKIDAALASLVESGDVAWGYFTPGAGKEWVDSRALESFQSRTLSLLRTEVQPVSALHWQAEVARLQGLVSEKQGRLSLDSALESLAGVAVTAEEWVRTVLPARVESFSISALNGAFASRAFVWVVEPGASTRGYPVRIIPRGSGNLYLPDSQLTVGRGPELRPAAAAVMEFMRNEGVVTSSDLRAALPELPLMEVRDALQELVLAGLITADSWGALAAMAAAVPDTQDQAAQPSVSRALYRRKDRGPIRRGVARRLREAATAMPPDVKWMPVARFTVMGPVQNDSKRGEARAKMLLRRYGVASRYVVEHEGGAWAWSHVNTALALMELRGTARRGYFVQGLPGVQYAVPSTVESLRVSSPLSMGEGHTVEPLHVSSPLPMGEGQGEGISRGASIAVLCAADPGFVLDRAFEMPGVAPALRMFTRVPSTYLVLEGRAPVILAERNGESISVAGNATGASVLKALAALRDHLVSTLTSRRVSVRQWNGQPVMQSQGVEVLVSAGFSRDYLEMSFDALRARVLAAKKT